MVAEKCLVINEKHDTEPPHRKRKIDENTPHPFIL